MIGRGRKAKGDRGGCESANSDTGSSFMSRTSTNISDGQPSLDSASSVYSHQTSSAHGPSSSKVNLISPPSRNILQLDGIVNNPYGYTTEVAGQTARTETNQVQQTIATTASCNASAHKKALPPPPGNDQDRGNDFAGSLRKSRPQSIWFRPEGGSEAGARVDPIADLRTTNPIQLTTKLERFDDEDEAVDQTEQEIRRIKTQDVGAARNALHMARQAFEVGIGTLSQLQQQGDRLKKAEKNLDQASSANKDGARKLKALKQADRMINVKNPFTEAKREKRSDNEMLAALRSHRNEQDRIRAAGWQASKENNIHKFTDIPRHRGATSKDILSRAKFQFEPDSDDEELEDVIEGTLDEIAGVAQQLKGLALAHDEELQQHNGRLDRMRQTSDKVDDGHASNRLRLDRFH